MKEVLRGGEYVIKHNTNMGGGRVATGGQVTWGVPSDDPACGQSYPVMDSHGATEHRGIDRRKREQDVARRIISRMQEVDELETWRLRGSRRVGGRNGGRADVVRNPPSEWRSSEMNGGREVG